MSSATDKAGGNPATKRKVYGGFPLVPPSANPRPPNTAGLHRLNRAAPVARILTTEGATATRFFTAAAMNADGAEGARGKTVQAVFV